MTPSRQKSYFLSQHFQILVQQKLIRSAPAFDHLLSFSSTFADLIIDSFVCSFVSLRHLPFCVSILSYSDIFFLADFFQDKNRVRFTGGSYLRSGKGRTSHMHLTRKPRARCIPTKNTRQRQRPRRPSLKNSRYNSTTKRSITQHGRLVSLPYIELILTAVEQHF